MLPRNPHQLADLAGHLPRQQDSNLLKTSVQAFDKVAVALDHPECLGLRDGRAKSRQGAIEFRFESAILVERLGR